MLVFTAWVEAGKALWLLGLVLWVVLNYGFLTGIIAQEQKPALEAGISGEWLLLVVATEALSVLGTALAPALGAPKLVLLVAVFTCLSGAMVYSLLITLILYRWLFFPLKPEQLMPPYWINMGALAITGLAASGLLEVAPGSEWLGLMAPFLRGLALLFWAAATWWIPWLILLGLWRHGICRVPLRYEPQYWSLVFPLGMYSATTFAAWKQIRVPLLQSVSWAFAMIALGAWVITFVSMLRNLAATVWKGRRHLRTLS